MRFLRWNFTVARMDCIRNQEISPRNCNPIRIIPKIKGLKKKWKKAKSTLSTQNDFRWNKKSVAKVVNGRRGLWSPYTIGMTSMPENRYPRNIYMSNLNTYMNLLLGVCACTRACVLSIAIQSVLCTSRMHWLVQCTENILYKHRSTNFCFPLFTTKKLLL